MIYLYRRLKGVLMIVVLLGLVLEATGQAQSPQGAPSMAKSAGTQSSTSKQSIRGVVYDETNFPLMGAQVRIKGQEGGVLTDADGAFEIKTTNASEVITISYIGFKPQTITAKVGHLITVVMEPNIDELGEVVVTGILVKSKNSYTGSLTTVSRDQLLSAGTKNILSSIASFVPGMVVLEDNLAGSNPNNTNLNIEFRGRSSFEGAANIPLFVVDGAQVSLEYVFDMDMNDVEQVTILKDASATALYGAKGAAGVIVITTKAPEGGALRFSYSGTARVAMPDLSEYHLLNSAEKLEFERLAGLYSSTSPDEQYRLDRQYAEKYRLVQSGINTDWLSKPLRTAVSHNHNVGVSGGEGSARYSVNLRYGRDEGVMKGSYRERLSSNFRLSYNLDRTLFVSNLSTINYVNSAESPYGAFSSYSYANPYDSPYDETGSLRRELSYRRDNPLYEASIGNYDRSGKLSFMNVTDLQVWINKDLRIDGSLSLSMDKDDNRTFTSPLSRQQLEIADVSQRGRLVESNSKSMSINGRINAVYNKYVTDAIFATTSLGGTIESTTSDGSSYSSIGFFSDKLGHPAFAASYPSGSADRPSGSDDVSHRLGLFFNTNWMYENRYFVDANLRVEGASQFGANHRFAPFWSLGAGWNIHNEEYMKESGFSLLKLRASTGYTGSANFPSHMARTTLEYRSQLNYGKGTGAVAKTIGNPDLKWQRQYTNNVGVDLSVLKGRVDVSVDAYIKTTNDLLLDVTKAPSIGFTTVMENLGVIENKGIEWQMRFVPITGNGLHWALSFNGSVNKNKIKKISNALKSRNETNRDSLGIAPLPVYEEGGSMSDLKVVPSAGIDPATGREIYIRPDGSYTFDYDSRYKRTFGVTTPVVNGSIGSYLTYKQLSLNLLFGYTLGAVEYNSTLASRVEGANPRANADYRVFESRWKEPGDNAKYKDIALTEATMQTSRFVQTNNTLDLRSLSLAYEFVPEQLKRIKLRSLRLELQTNNLFYISTIKRERGLAYPFERSVELSLRTTF